MKKTYETPQVIVHGSVHQMTAASQDSDRQDRIFNADGTSVLGAGGSLDQCFADPDQLECTFN